MSLAALQVLILVLMEYGLGVLQDQSQGLA